MQKKTKKKKKTKLYGFMTQTYKLLTPEDSPGTHITVSIWRDEDYSGVGPEWRILSEIPWEALNVLEIDQQRQIKPRKSRPIYRFWNFYMPKNKDSIRHKDDFPSRTTFWDLLVNAVDRLTPDHYINKLRMCCEINKLENIFLCYLMTPYSPSRWIVMIS